MQPVLDETKPVAVGDEPNGLGRAGSANFHSDSGDDASHSAAYGISLHGDTVSAGTPGQGPAGCLNMGGVVASVGRLVAAGSMV